LGAKELKIHPMSVFSAIRYRGAPKIPLSNLFRLLEEQTVKQNYIPKNDDIILERQ
jgi:hypothetical protein